MLVNGIHSTQLNSYTPDIRARVEVHLGSTLEKVCDCGRELSEFTVERTGENKFFGYGICQKLKTVFFDESVALSITKENTLEVAFGANNDFMYPFPTFYVEEIKRDEESGDLTAIAYDCLYRAANYRVSDLQLTAPYTIMTFVSACAAILGVPLKLENIENIDAFQTSYAEGANFDGSETVRSALDSIAEVTQTIYYINNNWELTFKRLDRDGDPAFTINRSNYMSLSNDGARTLNSIAHITELGDNVSFTSGIEGTTQYIRDNPFWNMREDVGDLVDAAYEVMGGITINQFECDWFGNYLLEIGDKLNIVAKGDVVLTTYLLDDSLTFDGEIEQLTQWKYDENDAETESNPTSLGEAISQTYARVDKVNKRIDLVVSDVSGNEERVSALEITADGIKGTVSEVQTNLDTANNDFNTLKKEVETKMTSDAVTIAIKSELSNGVETVRTSTGFTFNEEGLTINKENNPITTQITENGMTVYHDNEARLIANSVGVQAANLHATTYLLIGETSRFEDFTTSSGEVRTACFWIGR